MAQACGAEKRIEPDVFLQHVHGLGVLVRVQVRERRAAPSWAQRRQPRAFARIHPA
jgi:hypothetical protein